MTHPLLEKIRNVERRARRLRLVRGGAFCCLLLVGVLMAAGLADYLMRIEDAGFRVLLSCLVFSAAGYGIVRWVSPVWRYRANEVSTAQRIEKWQPALANRLSSAVAFLEQPDDGGTAGSYDLRRAVVAMAVAEVEGMDFARSLDPRPARRAALSAGVILVLAVCFFVADPAAATLAAKRLAVPWMNEPWPRRHVLQLVDPPTRIAVGSDFEVEVIDRNGHLPRAVFLQYQFEDEASDEIQVKELRYLGDRLVHRIENVRRPFRYRAVGGDDDTMEWISLTVAEPPRIQQLQIQLVPPTYTGWDIASSAENIHALQGTRIQLTGTLDKPAKDVVLKTDQGNPSMVSIRLDPDALQFGITADSDPPWLVSDSCTYWFETMDPKGLRGTDERRWSIRAVEDRVPAVSLQKPPANTFVIPAAVVTLDGFAEDDLALRSIAIRYRRSDEQNATHTVPIYKGPQQMPAETGSAQTGRHDPASDLTDRRSLAFEWDLGGIPELSPGIWIDYEVVAEDYKPQTGQSGTRRLTIITVAELEERIAAKQTYILGQLAEIIRLQREVRSQVSELEIQVEQTASLGEEDIDRLQSAELGQRDVSRLLADPNDGVESQIASLLQELQGNRLESREIQERMAQLLEAVDEIRRQHLPDIQRFLLSALKSARERAAHSPEGVERGKLAPLAAPLQDAGTRQDQVINILERLLGDLSQWDSYRRFHRELHRLKGEQEVILQDTESARLDALGKELDAEQRARVARIAGRQDEAARQFDKIRSRMVRMQGELAHSDASAAQTLADALDAARRTAVGGRMREGARRVALNRLGEAVEQQASAIEGLEELLSALANRRELELQQRLQKMAQAASELERMRQQQHELSSRIGAQAESQTDESERRRTEQEQRELAEAAQLLARRLERLLAEQAAESTEEAAQSMETAAQETVAGNDESATEASADAERQLEQAANRLESERRTAEQDLLFEQLARLEQEIGGLIARQQAVLDTTQQLELLRSDAGDWTRGQRITVADLARQQRLLATDTARVKEKTAGAAVFQMALQGIAAEMDRAARGLDGLNTGEITQLAQQSALYRLHELKQALKRDPRPGENQESGAGDQPPSNQPPGDALQQLAEFKLLRSLQQEIHRRTIQLEEKRLDDGSLPEESEQTLVELTLEQGRLAELVMRLSAGAASAVEDARSPSETPRDPGEELEEELLRGLEDLP